MKPHIVEWCNRHLGFVDISDYMANGYLMSQVDHEKCFSTFWI